MVLFESLSILILCLTQFINCNPVVPKNKDSIQFVYKEKEDAYRGFDSQSIHEKIHGVNLGGWLVLEPYITPSLFEAFRTNPHNDDGIPVDEYNFCKRLGYEKAKERLCNHWSTFYKEEDFAKIASQGFNLVRIPVGYWAFTKLSHDPYVTTEQEYFLDRAIDWARKYGLKVWIDLHGAAGSQNGFDNSGLRDLYRFLDDENLSATMKALTYILSKYSTDVYSDTVIGIELLNEPLGPVFDMERLKNFLLKPAYDYLRNKIKSSQIIVIHDAFQPYNYWDNFLNDDQEGYGVIIDHHHYQVFSPVELARKMDERITITCQWGTGTQSERHLSVAGEFSAALTDCTKWLNGVGFGARYDGTWAKGNDKSYYIGSCVNNENVGLWSEERRQNTRKYIEAQLDAFEMSTGWIMWCYKTENSVEWDVEKLIQHNLFPQPISNRKYPNQCR
ncbi:spr1p [Saccharomyces arboricola H-6]|uniref:glucan 1,3-beta-glucosidase n=1 Tax=Saccharomyces arboricola (strain H-6 / AS 2.3317 / CBS 10644) TaxID=1160507 RepID=J8PHR4_SACAR|nr:spr1p [Saccharomyces arboricola H-6]